MALEGYQLGTPTTLEEPLVVKTPFELLAEEMKKVDIEHRSQHKVFNERIAYLESRVSAVSTEFTQFKDAMYAVFASLAGKAT